MLVHRRAIAVGVGLAASALILSGCSGAGGGSGASGDVTLTLATVNNPQMKDMEELKGTFEKENPGIKVKFVQLEEGDLRAAVTADVASGAGQYDVVTVGAYEVPQWGEQGWLKDLTGDLAADKEYDVEDLFPPVRDAISFEGKQYAVPFYGESSILMYNKEMFAEAGLTMSNNPTWQEVEAAAKTLNTPEHAGICLRGKPGWGDL
jgi:sorbitol/mannitol transport system substrate-binding protein